MALTWDLVDLVQELVLDLVEGIVLVGWLGGVLGGDQSDGRLGLSQGTGPRWLSGNHGRCIMLKQVPLRHLGCTHSPWKDSRENTDRTDNEDRSPPAFCFPLGKSQLTEAQ